MRTVITWRIEMCVREMQEDGLEIETQYPKVVGVKTVEVAV